MDSYKRIVAFHRTHDLEGDDEYVQKKLENGLSRIWQDVQTKVRFLIVSNDVSDINIDQFIKIIDVVHELILVGGRFCESTSTTLAESLKQKCLAYFEVSFGFAAPPNQPLI